MLRRKFLALMAGGVAAGLTGLPAVLAVDKSRPGDRAETVAERLGGRMVEILKGATKVEVFRVSGKPAEKAEPGKSIGGYPILSTGKEQGQDFARRLSSLVQEENSLFSTQARCFNPGVAFRLWKDKESVEVVVCYQCWGLRLAARDAEGKEIHRTGGGFKANFGAWVKLAKEAFPDDKQIQSLGETGGRDA